MRLVMTLLLKGCIPIGLDAARTCSRYVNTRRLRETSVLLSCDLNSWIAWTEEVGVATRF